METGLISLPCPSCTEMIQITQEVPYGICPNCGKGYFYFKKTSGGYLIYEKSLAEIAEKVQFDKKLKPLQNKIMQLENENNRLRGQIIDWEHNSIHASEFYNSLGFLLGTGVLIFFGIVASLFQNLAIFIFGIICMAIIEIVVALRGDKNKGKVNDFNIPIIQQSIDQNKIEIERIRNEIHSL